MDRIIKHDLLAKQKRKVNGRSVSINLYSYASELYEELNNIDAITRLKEVNQLGLIKISSKFKKTRYDYVVLQLYLHQLIKSHLMNILNYTYNNKVKETEFNAEYKYKDNKEIPSIYDILQILVLVYNIGHFYNTFVSSKAVIMMATENEDFRKIILDASDSERYKKAVTKMIDEKNYHQFHLINSLLFLEKCNQDKNSIKLAMEILYAYINENDLPENNKLKYIFSIFKNIRTVSYIAYDLQIANTPFVIDLQNDDAIIVILRELLSKYNNNSAMISLFKSINKLLDDVVYNKNSDVICYYRISRKMVNNLKAKSDILQCDYFKDYFICKKSILNKVYKRERNYNEMQILKLTFDAESRNVFEELLKKLESLNNTCVGYYNRYNGEQTIIVSIKKKCNCNREVTTAFKILKYAVSALKKIKSIESSDVRFLLCAKFFIYYFFNKHTIVINPTINKNKCVLCVRGKTLRILEIEKLLECNYGNEDERYEASFMIKCLQNDTKNDTSLCVPATETAFTF